MPSEEWQDTFDEQYVYFDRVQNSPVKSRLEAESIRRLLSLDAGSTILDIPCGYGRLSLELARLGANVIGVDGNARYVELAQNAAREAGLSIDFRVGDMRSYTPEVRVDAVLCWFGSFGYFSDVENQNVLEKFAATLQPNGRLVLQFAASPGVFVGLAPRSKHLSITKRDLDERLSLLSPNRLGTHLMGEDYCIVDGRATKTKYQFRIYSVAELSRVFVGAGLEVLDLYGSGLRPYHWSDSQCTVVAARATA